MKNTKLIGFLIIVVSSFMFIQCTSDVVTGPQGEAGIDGIDGTNGSNGTDGTNGVDGVGTASCIACHSESHREPINASYAMSGHAAGGAVAYAGSRGSCSQCHSNEGFINYVTGQPAVDIENPTAISCTTCHEKHSTFDFENDGYDYALRTFEPVTLMTDEAYTIDLGDKSNTCVNCHQPRRTGPVDDGAGTFTVTSTHWGPHHGPQATLLEGIQGSELAGTVSYPAVGSSTHRAGASCVSCHMGESTDSTDGVHSMITSEASCLTCHGSVPTEVGGLEADLETLAALLEAAEGTDATTGDPVIGIIHDGHPQKGIFTIKESQAAWNYLFIMEDASKGVHNPAYARALITNSIEALQ